MNKYLKNTLRVLSIGALTVTQFCVAYGTPVEVRSKTIKTVNSESEAISGLKIELINGNNSWITNTAGEATLNIDTIELQEIKILDIDSTENGHYKDTVVNIEGNFTFKSVKMQEK